MPNARRLIQEWRPELIVGAVAVACFLNVLPNGFCYDDLPIVSNNARVNEPDNWLAIWTTDYWSEPRNSTPNRDLLYRPIALSSYRLIRVLFGLGPFAHHLANVVLHSLISILIVRFCRHVGGSRAQALAAGVLFAVLPIHTEVVASVVGRADLLATAGVLLTLLSHRRSMLATTTRGTAAWCAAASVTTFVALGAKESALSLFALVPLMHLYWRRRIADCGLRCSSLPPAIHNARCTILQVASLLIPLGFYLLLRYDVLGGQLHQRPPVTKTINLLVDAPLWQHALGVMQLWGMYWAKTFWPAMLCCTYSINAVRLATDAMDPHVLLGSFITVGLVVTSVLAWRRGIRIVTFLSVAIALSYALTANAAPLLRVFFAERIWYLPSVFVVILAGLAAGPLLRRPFWIVAGLLIVTSMTLRTFTRNAEWRSNGTLFFAAYRDQPDSITALYLYGQWLAANGEPARGIELLNRTVQMDLGYTDAQRALGRAYLSVDDYQRAVRHLQIAVMQIPIHRPTNEALARARNALSGFNVSELMRLKQAVELHPGDVNAETALVRKLRNLGHASAALLRLQKRENAFSDRIEWQSEYAVTLVYLNQIDKAIERYRICLDLDNDNPQLAVELAMLLLERRRPATGSKPDDLDQAWALAAHAASIAPREPSVLVCQAELLALRGDLAAAVELYHKAIGALPPNSSKRRVYEQRAKVLGGG